MITKLHEQVKRLQKRMEDENRTDVAEVLACACLNLRVAQERLNGEGKTGDQTSSRKYSGPSNSRGHIPKREKSALLDPENSQAAQQQRQYQKQRHNNSPTAWNDPDDKMPF